MDRCAADEDDILSDRPEDRRCELDQFLAHPGYAGTGWAHSACISIGPATELTLYSIQKPVRTPRFTDCGCAESEPITARRVVTEWSRQQAAAGQRTDGGSNQQVKPAIFRKFESQETQNEQSLCRTFPNLTPIVQEVGDRCRPGRDGGERVGVSALGCRGGSGWFGPEVAAAGRVLSGAGRGRWWCRCRRRRDTKGSRGSPDRRARLDRKVPADGARPTRASR
jgi:hypothetical protein